MVDFVKIRIVLVTALVGAVIGAGYTYVAHNALPVGLLIGAAFGSIFPSIEILLFKGTRARGSGVRRSLSFLG